jgi:hypothetical protein
LPLAPLVEHLGIFTPGPAGTIQEVIHACPGVKSLACGFTPAQINPRRRTSVPAPVPVLPPSPQTKEQHLLGLACRDGWDPAAIRPGITHLRIHLVDTRRSLLLLPTLPERLTHLALVYRAAPSASASSVRAALHALLDMRPELQVVLVQVVGRGDKAQTQAVDELNRSARASSTGAHRRLVAERAPFSVVAQWESASRHGQSVWDLAEQELRERERERKRRWSEPAGKVNPCAWFFLRRFSSC